MQRIKQYADFEVSVLVSRKCYVLADVFDHVQMNRAPGTAEGDRVFDAGNSRSIQQRAGFAVDLSLFGHDDAQEQLRHRNLAGCASMCHRKARWWTES